MIPSNEDITNILQQLDNRITQQQIQNKIISDKMSKKIQLENLLQQCFLDEELIQTTIAELDSFYEVHKQTLSQELCDELTDIVNMVFDNTYNFKFTTSYNRNYTYTNLIDTIRNGKVKNCCGSACRQMISFIISVIILKHKGSEILCLDESFSNFGVEEIKKMPEILSMIDNVQIIFTEHKIDLEEYDNMNIIEIVRENDKSSTYPIQQTPEHIVETINEINNKELTEQDIHILQQFNIH